MNIIKANKVFTDRVEPKEILTKEIESVENRKGYKRIYVFYGIGGIGKTRFLEEMRYDDEQKKKIVQFVHVSLNIYEFDNPVKILTSIRKQLSKIDLIVFDYALVQYYSKNGMTSTDITSKFHGVNSSMMLLFKNMTSGGKSMIPYYDLVRSSIVGMKSLREVFQRKKFKEMFQFIDTMSATEIYDRLPEMLATAINDANQRLILYLDDYESMVKKLKDLNGPDNYESWLIHFFEKLETALLVISAREKLAWENDYPFLDDAIHQYYLDKLTKKDARDFLISLPIKDDEIVEQIVNLAEGIPLFLDMCADLYFNQDSTSDDKDLFKHLSLKSLIDRYLRHFNDQERSLVLYLSYLQAFDYDFVRYLSSRVNIAISDVELKHFLERSLFIDNETMKTVDESVRKHIFDSKKNKGHSGIQEVLKDYLEDTIPFEHTNYSHYFKEYVLLVSKESLSTPSVEFLIASISRLVDRGYAMHLDEVMAYAQQQISAEFQAVYDYFQLLKFRRQGKINEAMSILKSHKEKGFDVSVFGSMEHAYTLLKVLIKHLAGHYDLAIQGYQDLIEEHQLLGSLQDDSRTLAIARIKQSDLLFLKGRFHDALNATNAININELDQMENKMELLRVKGHIYRFNLDFDTADKLYRYILEKESDRDLKIMGNAYTNLCETHCLRNPDLAIDYGEKGIPLLESIHSYVELGKMHAALAYAYAKNDDIPKAYDHADQSIRMQTENGYQSGILFGLYAMLYVEFKSENPFHSPYDLQSLRERILTLTDKLGVYDFLLLIPHCLYGESYSMLENIQWLDFAKTKQTMLEII